MAAAESTPIFEVLLEKRSRGRILSMSRSWALRTIRLTKQTLSYYDGNDLKGSVDISGAALRLISPADADSKSFPFEIDIGSEKLLFNASCSETRSKCMEIFTLASKTAVWDEIQVDRLKRQQSEETQLIGSTLASNPSTSSLSSHEKEGLLNERKGLEEKSRSLPNERKVCKPEENTEIKKDKCGRDQEITEKNQINRAKLQFLSQGMALSQNQYLQSLNGVYYAVMQADGNFVVYVSRHTVPSNAIWSTNTVLDEENGPFCLTLKEDGHLVLLDVSCTEQWKSMNSDCGSPEYCLKLEDDGNLVLRDGGQVLLWQSNSSRGDPTLLLPY